MLDISSEKCTRSIMVESIQSSPSTLSRKAAAKQKSLQNLRPQCWKKGESGNPHGRPRKEFCIPDILRRIMAEPDPDDVKRTKLEGIMRKVQELAADGEEWAVEFIAVRTEGKPADTINLNQQEPPRIFVERINPSSTAPTAR